MWKTLTVVLQQTRDAYRLNRQSSLENWLEAVRVVPSSASLFSVHVPGAVPRVCA